MRIDRPNSEKLLRSVTYQGPKLWNELPPGVRDLNDTSKFDSEIMKLVQSDFEAMTNV